jgi:hemoglobin-like flavoprotein
LKAIDYAKAGQHMSAALSMTLGSASAPQAEASAPCGIDEMTLPESPMTPLQITLVQSTFAKVAPISKTAAKLFYDRLFELDPSLRRLFKGDIEEQGRKLMQVLGFAVGSLNDTAALLPAVSALGERHSRYGVLDQHYDTVGAALLWTLEKGLGDAFTPPVKAAWTQTYSTLAQVMKEASAKCVPAA